MKKIEELLNEDETFPSNSLNISIESKLLIQKIKSIVLTIIICIGLIGNSLNLIIFGKKKMRKVTTFKYLFYLSLNNLLVLGVGATDVLMSNIFQFEIRSYSNAMCKLHTFFTYVVTHSANLIQAAVNIERTVMMRNADESKQNPIRTRQIVNKDTDLEDIEMMDRTINLGENLRNRSSKSSFFKQHSVFIAMCMILAFIFVLNSHYILFLRLKRNSNDIQSNVGKNFKFLKDFVAKNTSLYILLLQRLANEKINYQVDICFAERGSRYENFIQNIWFWLDMSVYSVMPFMVMCICSLLIVFKFREMNRNYLRLLANNAYKYNRKYYERKIKKNRQICLMLLNSNVYFLLSTFQFWACFYMYGKNNEQAENVIQLYVYIFLYANNAIDFLMYGMSSEKYRHELVAIFYKNDQQTQF